MRVIYDEPKRLSILDKHGLDMADFAEAFDFDGAARFPAHPSRIGRARFGLIGRFDGAVVVAAIVSPLGGEAPSPSARAWPARGEGIRMASDGHVPGFVPGRGYTREDWDAVCDGPEITPEQAAASPPLAEAMPELVAAMRRGRGDPRAAAKDLVSLRLDRDVLATLRASGSGWQSRANEMLRRGLGLDAPGEG